MVFRSFLSKSSWFFPELGKWVSQESTPLADCEEGFLKTEERGNQRKNERVQRWSNETGPQPAGPKPAVYPKVHGFWTKLSERSMLNYSGASQRKIALAC